MRIGVIGAGFSGLAAAKVLMPQGRTRCIRYLMHLVDAPHSCNHEHMITAVKETPPPDQVRKSVTLSAADLRDLELVRQSPEALEWLGAASGVTEAALLRLLLERGLKNAVGVAIDIGYSQLAISYRDDDEERHTREAVRANRRIREDVE